jgi:hypothetical protein
LRARVSLTVRRQYQRLSGDEMTRNASLIRYAVLLSVLAAIVGRGIGGRAAPADKPSPQQITQVTLERIGGGPQPSDLPPDKVVLRRDAMTDPVTAQSFDRLARWLQASGFFSLRGGYEAMPFPPDVGSLSITVVRNGQAKRVVSYNGSRDAALWRTEMVIRGVAAEIRVRQAQRAWMNKHRTTQAEPQSHNTRCSGRQTALLVPRRSVCRR